MHVEEPETGMEVLKSVRRTLRVLIASTIVLMIAVGALAGYAITKANSTEDSLCALRVNAQEQIVESQSFLNDNPKGIPGISPEVIRAGIDRQQAVVNALSNLSCQAPPADTTTTPAPDKQKQT